jgi:hypothetical protein
VSRSPIKEEYIRVAVQLPKELGEYVKKQGDTRRVSYSSIVLEMLAGVEQLRADSDALLSLYDLAAQIQYCDDDSQVLIAAQKIATVILGRSVRKPSTVAGDMITALTQAGKKAMGEADQGSATRAARK